MSSSEERVGKIQSLFRNVNEQIAEAADRFDVESARLYCECHDPACGERVDIPLDEYEKVRAKPTRFVHAPGHVERSFERVVARRHSYAVVEKFGSAQTMIVRRLDPRGENAEGVPSGRKRAVKWRRTGASNVSSSPGTASASRTTSAAVSAACSSWRDV